MKRLLVLIMLFSLCTCNNVNTSESNVGGINETDFDELENKYKLIELETNYDKKVNQIAYVEASIIDEAKIFPISTSNKYVLTNTVKSDYCPIIINGKNYYKVKNFAVNDKLITNKIQDDISKECFTNNLLFSKYLTNNEYKLYDTYSTHFTNSSLKSLELFDYSNSLQNEVLLQCQDGLLDVDIFGNIVPCLAKSFIISNDKLKYTFTLKDNIYFIDHTGNKYDSIEAIDFVNGFKYMLDKGKNIKAFTNITNINEYIEGKASFDTVGVKVIDNKTIEFSLNTIDGSILEKIANNIIPINLDFIKVKGNSYANINDLSNMLYTGAYYPTLISNDKVTLTKNPHYYDKSISIETINYINDNNDLINKFNEGIYNEVEVLDTSTIDNSLLTSRFIDSSIRYGLINTNRKSYEVYNSNVKSNKDETQRNETTIALNNINFRKALISCINKDIFIENNMKVDNLSLYNNYLSVDDCIISYNEYVSSLVKDPISYNLENGKLYYDKYKQEQNISSKIILDVVCYKNNKSMINKINQIKTDIESTLNDVSINIVYCDTLYDYFLAGHTKYQCYDLYFDFSVNCEYNSRSEYLKEILNYI